MEMRARLPFASRGMQPFRFSFWKNVGGVTVSIGSSQWKLLYASLAMLA